MIAIERTHDMELVRSIITHPRIYPHVTDDYSPKAEDFRSADDSRIFYLIAKDKSETLGMFMFIPQNGVCFNVHVCMLPCSWGERVRQSGVACLNWIWKNTRCQKITAEIPSFNRLVCKFARDMGMYFYGVNRNSFQKHGILYDLILMGIERPGGELCQ